MVLNYPDYSFTRMFNEFMYMFNVTYLKNKHIVGVAMILNTRVITIKQNEATYGTYLFYILKYNTILIKHIIPFCQFNLQTPEFSKLILYGIDIKHFT